MLLTALAPMAPNNGSLTQGLPRVWATDDRRLEEAHTVFAVAAKDLRLGTLDERVECPPQERFGELVEVCWVSTLRRSGQD